MDDKTYQLLSSIFDREHASILGDPTATSAQNRLQNELRDAILFRIQDTAIGNAVRKAFEALARYSDSGGLLATGLSLAPEAVDRLKQAIEATQIPKRSNENAIAVIASILCETGESDSSFFGSNAFTDWLCLPIAREMASYLSYKQLDTVQNGVFSPYLSELERQIETSRNWNATIGEQVISRQQQLVKLSEETQSAIDNVSTMTRQTDERLKAAEAISNDFQAQLLPMIEKTNRAQADMNAFVQSLREKAAHSEAATFWISRARWSALAFGLSMLALLILLAYIPYYALSHYEEVLKFVRRVGETIIPTPAVPGTNPQANTPQAPIQPEIAQAILATVGRLIVIAAPAALYFWLIRILVRYNMHALVLMNDARQRATIMDTYIHLHAKNIALPEDRPVMFGAMFRPLPGQPSDVEPPNLVDIYKLKGEG